MLVSLPFINSYELFLDVVKSEPDTLPFINPYKLLFDVVKSEPHVTALYQSLQTTCIIRCGQVRTAM